MDSRVSKKELVALLLFGVLISIFAVEVSANIFPLFQTDVRFIAEGMDKDPHLFSRFKSLDANYVSADLKMYNVKTNILVSEEYYIRDETPVSEVFGVAVGDSFTYCAEINIEDCWVNLLESKLGKDIVNLGSPGQFSITEERILTDYGLQLKPKIVVWQFMTNDISDAAYFKYNDTEPTLYGVRKFLNARSNTYVLLKRVANALFNSGNAPLTFVIDGERNTFNNIEVSKNTNAYCNTEISNQVKSAILNSKEKSENNGSKFLLIMIPMKEEVYIEKLNAHLGTDYDLSCPIREIRELAEGENIDFIDMTDFLKDAVRNGKLPYLKIGGHLSPEGNQIVADTIYDFLRKNEDVPN